MKFLIAFFVAAVFLNAYEYATLEKISDGDTFTLKSQHHKEFKCRVFGIDTPETFHTDKMDKDASKVGITKESM